MRIQLRLFLARFNAAIAAYSLARLEAVLANPDAHEAPVLQRLGKATLQAQGRENWPQISRRVDALSRYINAVAKGKIRLADENSRQRLIERARAVIKLRNSISALYGAKGSSRTR